MKYLNNGNETDLINCVKTFMKDDQDFVKLYIVESLVVLGQVLSPQVISESLSSYSTPSLLEARQQRYYLCQISC